MERLRGNRSLSAALTGITAAVVGVIANLGVYFAVHTLFAETRDGRLAGAVARGARPGIAAAGRARHRRGRRRAASSGCGGRSCAPSGCAPLLGLAAGLVGPAGRPDAPGVRAVPGAGPLCEGDRRAAPPDPPSARGDRARRRPPGCSALLVGVIWCNRCRGAGFPSGRRPRLGSRGRRPAAGRRGGDGAAVRARRPALRARPWELPAFLVPGRPPACCSRVIDLQHRLLPNRVVVPALGIAAALLLARRGGRSRTGRRCCGRCSAPSSCSRCSSCSR